MEANRGLQGKFSGEPDPESAGLEERLPAHVIMGQQVQVIGDRARARQQRHDSPGLV